MTKADRPNPRRTTVFVCRKCKGHGSLARFLHDETAAAVKEVGCQDVCQEPVCGLRLAGTLQWFGGMDGRKRRRALAELVAGLGVDPDQDRLPPPLAKARSRKRAGKVR